LSDLSTRRGRRRALAAWAAVLAALSISCGYKLVREPSARLPSGVSSISIPLARNLTLEAGLEDVFTQELIKRLSADGRVTILPAQGQAELRCVMRDISTHPVSFTREGRVAAESVTIEAECALLAPESESLIWSSGPAARSEEYPVGDNYLANEDAKAAAINEICRDLSETMQNALMDSF